jgi:hypothetical protein
VQAVLPPNRSILFRKELRDKFGRFHSTPDLAGSEINMSVRGGRQANAAYRLMEAQFAAQPGNSIS